MINVFVQEYLFDVFRTSRSFKSIVSRHFVIYSVVRVSYFDSHVSITA